MSGASSGGSAFGFDHVVIAVRDLGDAIRQYTRLGFHVEPGGRHPGFGTANALIQLDNGYIELLAVEDRGVARGAGIRRRELVDYLDARPGGAIGYALTCDSLAEVQRRGGGAQPRLDIPPLEMSRVRPDGSTLRWRLVVPGGSTWCRPWPFLIEWNAAEPGPAAAAASAHPNGAVTIDSLVVGARSLDEVSAFFVENLGVAVHRLPGHERDARRRAGVEVGGCLVELVELGGGAASGPLPSTVEGEGPGALRIRVRSLDAASRLLEQNGIRPIHDGPSSRTLDEASAAGAKLALVAGH
jgi:catechol 2,3-dioxygenase-like lactoylglutathione lyase family enzyme